MSEVAGVLQSGGSEDHRSGKLQRQTEVDNGIREDISAVLVACPTTVTIPEASNGVTSVPSAQPRGNFSSFPDDAMRRTMLSSNNRKTQLSRGCAMEGTSPPPDSVANHTAVPNGEVCNGQSSGGAVGGSVDRHGKLNGQSHEAKDLLAIHAVSNDSGIGTFDQTDESSDTSALSRDSSVENATIRHVYKDSTNTNILIFFKETIRRSAKDKKTVLMFEDQLLNFIDCSSVEMYKTGELTSYDRMIVHRMAAYLGLEHNVDGTGRCVVLNKTKNTRSVKLSEAILFEDDGYEPQKRILLKKPASFDEKHSRGSKAHFGSNRAKSLEERKENYKVARERIFKTDENQLEGEPDYKNFVPYHNQQPMLDSTKTNGHLPGNPGSSQPSDFQRNVMYSMSSNSIKPFHQSSSHVPAPVVTPTEHDLSACSSIVDASPSPVTHMQPHASSDGSLYQFDPTCPPPFMVQLPTRPPPATPPPSHIVYQNDGVSDLATRFSAASVGSLEQGSEPMAAGVVTQPVPFFIPQSVYTPVYPSQLMQGQYFLTSAPASAQPSLQYITLPPGQAQQVLQGATMDTQGQVTVPMPPLGVPAVQNNGTYQMLGSPYQFTMALSQTSHSVDHNSVTYHYGPAPEAVMMTPNTSAPGRATGAQQLFLAYPQPQSVSQQTQFAPAGTTPQGTYYSIPATTPTPPLSLTQPPPASHHQQQPPQAVYFTSSFGTPLTYPVSMPDPSSPSASSLRPVLTPFLQTQYISPNPRQQQQQLHPHHPQPLLISPQNSHHPAPMTVNCNQPIPYNPGQPLGQVASAQGPLLEAVQAPYQVRPLGGTLFHLAGNPMIQTPHLGANPHLQSYQFFRPVGTDVRLVNPGSVRARLSPLQITNTSTPRPRYNGQYRHPKKWGRKPSSDAEGCQVGQGPSAGQQTAHVNIISPLGVTGSIPLSQPHIQPSAHRQ